MVEPISSKDVLKMKAVLVPDYVIETINRMIVSRFSGTSAHFKKAELEAAVKEICVDGHYDSSWLSDESLRALYKDWKVEVDCRGFNEFYPTTITFWAR